MQNLLDAHNAMLKKMLDDGILVLDHENKRVLMNGEDATPWVNEEIRKLAREA